MIGEIKNWAKGVALAALVLSGSAMLDGQKIEGPKPEGKSTAEWHVVRSVMDIDNLPKGARFVNADGLNAAHLDFLAEVESLEGIRLRNGRDFRTEHLKSLKSLKKLQWLDIRGAGWVQEPDLSPLSDLPALKRVGADLIPASYWEKGIHHAYAQGSRDYYRRGYVTRTEASGSILQVLFDYEKYTLPTLSQLSRNGVEIELGRWRPMTQEQVSKVIAELPTMSSIIVDAPTAGVMKVLASHEKLTSIDLEGYDAGQIGLAYLARKGTLEALSIVADGVSLEELHQITRMGLHFLRIDAQFVSSPEQCSEVLAGMKNLRELELINIGIEGTGLSAFTRFKSMQRLDRLLIDEGQGTWFHLMAAHVIPTRKLVLRREDHPPIPEKSETPKSLLEGEAGKNLEEIRYELGNADFNPGDDDNIASFKSYPNLKRIEVQRGGFNEPTKQDEFVNWLKANLPGVEVVVTP